MRLVDVDKLSNVFENEMCKGCCAECVDEYGKCNCEIHYMKELLWQQPTAYDVDKVISEIEKCAIDNTDWGYSANPKLASYYLSRTAEVIDIVKRGGADDK